MPTRPASDVLAHDEGTNELVTGEAVSLDLRPASFVLRAAGSIIDYLVYLGGYFLFILLVTSVFDVDAAVLQAILISALVVAIVVVPTAVETISQGKSLGRLAVGTRIVRDDGGAIGFRHAFIRSLVGVLEIFLTFGGVAAIVGMLDSRARRLGDLIAGTYGQYERVSKIATPTYGVPVELIEWARTADVARMPDALSRRIAQYLAQASGYSPASRASAALSLAAEASQWVSPVPQADPELFLAAVAAIRRDREFTALQLEQASLDRLEPYLTGAPRGFPSDRG